VGVKSDDATELPLLSFSSDNALRVAVDEGTEREDPHSLIDGVVRGLLEGEGEADVRDAEGVGSELEDGRSLGNVIAPPATKTVAWFDG
jgi:hypothetical protein